MTLRRLFLSAVLLSASLSAVTNGSAQSAAITSDPASDKANPAAMQAFQLPSHGSLLNALVYVAAGAGPHPVVILLHGFPGNERNLDLAQSIRRAGWDVLFFDYRGSWGSPGAFSFAHSIEDAQSAVAYMRNPAIAGRLRADPKDIVLIGHSMGGMIAANVAAQDPTIRAVGLISAANMAGRVLPAVKANQQEAALPRIAQGLAVEGIAPLAGCTPESLAQELLANAAAWNIPDLASKLATGAGGPRSMFVITSDDGLADASDALVANLRKAGDVHVTSLHMATDHSYSDHRIALEQAVLDSLQALQQNEPK